MRYLRLGLLFFVCNWGIQQAAADVKLPALFSDHIVLQREMPVHVWGWAEPGEKVTVEFAGQTKSAVADNGGKWKITLDPLKVGEAQSLTVRGKNTLSLNDVLVGEVWICSGQSNMWWPMSGALNPEKEKAESNYPDIRMFTVNTPWAPASLPNTLQEQCKGNWEVCSLETAHHFSAVGYFFARDLYRKLHVPIGMIHSSVSGTPIEAWTSWDAQKDLAPLKEPLFDVWDKRQAEWDPAKAEAKYQEDMEKYKKAQAAGKPVSFFGPGKQPEPRFDQGHPAILFDNKINPLIPYAIRGAIWYQGESNAGMGPLYHLQLKTLIEDWRKRWGSDFYFGYVQLPEIRNVQKEPVEEGGGWTAVRDGMLQTLSLPKTGMAVAIGLGTNPGTTVPQLHPANKQAVAERLSRWALADVYGQKDVVGSGPRVKSHEIRGNEVVITFDHADQGLVVQGGGDLKGFAITGEDKKWVWANAKIDGDKVIVSSDSVAKPVAVRYAWADNPQFNLFNGAGLPASPFRTDDFPLPFPKQ